MQQTVYALAASPNFDVDGIAFAAGDRGLFSSGDGGASWRDALASFELPEPLPVTSVALSPSFGTDRRVYAGAPGGVLRSSDGGETWMVTALPQPAPTISALAVSPDFERDGLVIAGTSEDGIFRSVDRGAHWQPWNFGLLDLHVLALAFSPDVAADRIVFAGTESGIFSSSNGGRSWEECGFPTQLAPVLVLAVSPGFADDGTIYAGTEQHGLYRSTDRGGSWTRIAQQAVAGEVAALVLAPDRILVLGDGVLLGQGEQHWRRLDGDGSGEPTAVAAPAGLAQGATLLVGLAQGGVARVLVDR